MRAIVLSGGGAKGAYEIGVWAALKKLRIHYDIVTGTSVGALNAALMTQKTFYKGVYLWYHLNSKMVFNEEIKGDYQTKEGKKSVIKTYAKGVLNGGIDVSKLEDTVRSVIEPKKFFASKINMGIVTFSMKTLRPKKMLKKDLTENNLCDYLIASAACFPAFKMKQIENENFIDGGIYDNLPINLAIDLGADEIIAVDLKEVGVKQKPKKNLPITYIIPKNDIGSFLVFDKATARRCMKIGYNDTLKVLGNLDGNIYTFKKGDLDKNLEKYKNKYLFNLNKYLQTKKDKDMLDNILKITVIEKIFSKKNTKKDYTDLLEDLGKILEIPDTKIYSISKYNNLLISEFNKIEENREIEHLVEERKIKTLIKNKAIIKYIYNLLDTKNKKKLYGIIILFPKRFLQAVYLKTIIEK